MPGWSLSTSSNMPSVAGKRKARSGRGNAEDGARRKSPWHEPGDRSMDGDCTERFSLIVLLCSGFRGRPGHGRIWSSYATLL